MGINYASGVEEHLIVKNYSLLFLLALYRGDEIRRQIFNRVSVFTDENMLCIYNLVKSNIGDRVIGHDYLILRKMDLLSELDSLGNVLALMELRD